jgi:RHH-type proline utilization regulon transcriptional repressor/proline dehydrogenase/delta 1-pyrroline-5-carboxylate dehydrogenase
MDALAMGDPWRLETDIGPVIDAAARAGIDDHVARARAQGRVLKECPLPNHGLFVSPTLIEVPGIAALEREIFGPVLHVARFGSADLDRVIDAINATGYGLTFGLQTRIDDRVQHVTDRIHAGNLYVNRNQIGAIVGSQPFGGEGLSGTGPKAGGPRYMARFCAPDRQSTTESWDSTMTALPAAGGTPAATETRTLPGPTGESNRLSLIARPPLLCLGPGAQAAAQQAAAVQALGGRAIVATGALAPEKLETLAGFSGVMWWGDSDTARALEQALARRAGPILALIPGLPDVARVRGERHVCVDTTASGGNAALLGAAA